MIWPYLDHDGPIAFAHRGAAEGCGENTAEALEAAARLGFTHVETDVQATRDGVAVLFHDDKTDRLLGRSGVIADRDWSELARAEVAGGGRLVRLDEALSALPDLRLNLDAKTDDAIAPMARAITAAGAVHRVCAASFVPRRTAELRRRLGPGLCWSPAWAGVASVWTRGWGLPVGVTQAPAIQVPLAWHGIPIVTPRLLAAARRHAIAVHVWTIDDADEMHRLLDLGVDGLMTDRPRVLRDVIRARGHWPAG